MPKSTDGQQLLRGKNCGPRSNYSLLPHGARYRICVMRHSGKTLQQIIDDPEVAAACRESGVNLSTQGLSRIKHDPEYNRFVESRERQLRGIAEDQLASAIAKDIGSADAVGDTVKIELLRLVKSALPAAETAGDIQKLVRSAMELSNQVKDREIERLKARISELENQLNNRPGKSRGISEETLTEVEHEIGLL